MQLFLIIVCTFLSVCGIVPRVAAQDIRTTATFECISLYLPAPGGDAGECRVQYKAAAGADWREGYPLIFDGRDNEYRGSLIGLTPDTEYEIRLTLGVKTLNTRCRTRSENIPVGKITYLEAGDIGDPVKITESGTPDGYHLVTPREGSRSTIDVFNMSDFCVEIDADYVILRGVELRNAAVHAVAIQAKRHDIVVEDCRMTFWGRVGGPASMGNKGGSDSGIQAGMGAGNLILQRNRIENPRGASNDWTTGHPGGPQGITFYNTTGGNIIRYNEIVSTEDHGFNDGFSGGANFSFEGSPNRDSDIYGNVIEGSWDDAIEAEGANMNVRIWGNYINRFHAAIATACVSKGPCYIFRNVFAASRVTHADPTGGSMLKTDVVVRKVDGKDVRFGDGRRLVFHNTSLQPGGASHVFVIGGEVTNTMSRNNILWCSGRVYPEQPANPPNDFQHDFLVGRFSNATGFFLPSPYLEFYLSPRFRRVQWGKIDVFHQGQKFLLTDPVADQINDGIDGGVVIPGFNDGYVGSAPDMGAFENGAPPLRFGRHARQDAPWAPWELY